MYYVNDFDKLHAIFRNYTLVRMGALRAIEHGGTFDQTNAIRPAHPGGHGRTR